MIIAPLQFFGAGDAIFCQTLANDWIAQGHEVVWGIQPEWGDDFNRAYPQVKFVDYRTLPIDYNRQDEHDSNGYRVIPLRWSVEIMKTSYVDCMKTKYSMFNQHYMRWKEGAMWQRTEERERALFDKLGLNIGESYVVINETYQSDHKGHKTIIPDVKARVIKMRTIAGFSMFDWALVLERAKEIHTVSTSLFYMLEMLDLRQPIHLYPRNTDPRFDHIKYLFTKPYVLHYD